MSLNLKKLFAVENFGKKKFIVTVAFTAMMTALYFVFDRFLVFYPVQTVKISLNFIPVVIAAGYFGPISGMLVSGLGDLLGAILMPVGAPNPILTATAALSGLVYGLFLYGAMPSKRSAILRIITANLIISVVFSLAINTYALALMYGGGNVIGYFAVKLPGRALKEIIMFTVKVVACGLIVLSEGRLAAALNKNISRS